jgi:hypothetical protein
VAFFELVPFFERGLCCLPDFGMDFAFATRPPSDSPYRKGMGRLLIMPAAHQGITYVLNVRGELLSDRNFFRRRMPETLMPYRGVMRGKLRSLRGFLHMPPVS